MSDIKTSLIVARASNLAIGKDNQMLWHISEDFQYFKRVTMGKPMIMGRKTFESLPGVLPGRPHLVISRSGFSYDHDAVSGYTDLNAAIDAAKSIAIEVGKDEVFIVGGAQIYALALQQNLVDRMYITEVKRDYDADAFFPDCNKEEWREISRERRGGDPAYDFVILEKR